MDPLTAATAFSTVVSLIAEFRSQRENAATGDFDEFMSWVSETRHDQIKALILQNQVTTIGIKALLHEDRKRLAERFDRLDRVLASLASFDVELGQVGVGLRRSDALSQQAIGILQELKRRGSSKMNEHRSPGVHVLLADGHPSGPLDYEDSRYIEDDLQTLLDLGLLRLTHTQKGSRVFNWTRAANEILAT